MDQYELALKALRSLKPGETPNIALVARTYGVDRSQLSRRFRGVSGSKEAQYDNQRLLNEEQSRVLIKWINQLTERGLPPTNAMLENFAREISGKEPGKNWVIWWKKAHSDKVQQARDVISQKNEEAAQEQARKDDKKLQQRRAKEAKEAKKIENARIREERRIQREEEATEKQRLKDEQELAKLADLQLQNDVISTPKASKRPKKQISTQAKPKAQPEADLEAHEEAITTNRRGRAIRPPTRFRD
ncbi:pogo transposable element [Talaromyces pinophilus]|uniref:Pogo transposable element n=1 Tax=Talaromyces pinophilus TaxID=128442 RepID=A0A6V8H7F6_TALPI|nr:pogo transposable element [Talaromyces pinophilus]